MKLLCKAFDYAGFIISVESCNASHLDWLEEFLSPSFTVSESSPQVSIRHEVDSRRYKDLQAQGSSDTEIVAFVQDNDLLKLPVWTTSLPGILLHDLKYKAFYYIVNSQITVVCQKDDLKIRYSLMRIVRELAMGSAQTGGASLLHAAAFNLGNSTVVVTGPKEAGKTSLLSYVLSATDARYLTNDRLLVSFESGEITVRGMPTILSVRPGTFELFPGLLAQVERRRYRMHASLVECASTEAHAVRPWPDGRRGLTPAQWCDLFDSRQNAQGNSVHLLFPYLTGRPGGVELRRLTQHEVARRLESCRFGGTSQPQLSEAFTIIPENVTQQADTDVFNVLPHACAGFEIIVGQDAYADSKGADLLVKQFSGGIDNSQDRDTKQTELNNSLSLN